jgi:hypothetical protein
MRCMLVVAFALLAACEPVHVRADHGGHPGSRQARSAPPSATSDDCSRDPHACPAPPRPYDPAEAHLPSLLPYRPSPDVPSYD